MLKHLKMAGEAIYGLCGSYDEPLPVLFPTWVSSSSYAHAALVARVLRKSQSPLIYEHPEFIRDILNAAELIRDDAVVDIRSSIVVATHSGIRRGDLGEPFSEDVQMEQLRADGGIDKPRRARI